MTDATYLSFVVIVDLLLLGLRFSSGETHPPKVDAKDVITENEIKKITFLFSKSENFSSIFFSLLIKQFPQLVTNMSLYIDTYERFILFTHIPITR